MSTKQIETQLSAVTARIQSLRAEADRLEAWAQRLQSALDVMHLVEMDISPAAEHIPAAPNKCAPQKPTYRPPAHLLTKPIKERALTPAVGKAAQAGETLKELLRVKGDYIKPLEAVRLLKENHGLTIGLGKPGRETSDLSAALGHGKVEGLGVSRRSGWFLTEWIEANRIEPVGVISPESEADETGSDECEKQ